MFDFLKRSKVESKVRYQIIAENRETKVIEEASSVVFSGVEALEIAKAYHRKFGVIYRVLGIKWAREQKWVIPIPSNVLSMKI